MFWITKNHFLFVVLFDWGNAETQTSSVSRNLDGFALAESQTRKSGTIAPLIFDVLLSSSVNKGHAIFALKQ